MVSPHVKREEVGVLMSERSFGVTRMRASADLSVALRLSLTIANCAPLRKRICEIAAAERRYRHRRIHQTALGRLAC
jgi:hypothetical protein